MTELENHKPKYIKQSIMKIDNVDMSHIEVTYDQPNLLKSTTSNHSVDPQSHRTTNQGDNIIYDFSSVSVNNLYGLMKNSNSKSRMSYVTTYN